MIKMWTFGEKDLWVERLADHMISHEPSDTTARDDFEKQLAKYVGANYAIALNSGTSAIMVALMAADISYDAEVIGPNYGHPAWINCCNFLGIKPIPVDISIDTLCMDPNWLAEKINSKTEAVIFINHAGYVGKDLRFVREMCNFHNLKMIEDSASALGQKSMGIHAGATGDFGIYSFSAPKLITCGEGGALVMHDYKLHQEARKIANQGGWYDTPTHDNLDGGGNFMMPPYNAYFLSLQLNEIEKLIRHRSEIKNHYANNGLIFHGTSIYQHWSGKAAEIHNKFNKLGIESIYPHYTPLHKHLYIDEKFPFSEIAARDLITVPNSLTLTPMEIKSISTIIKMTEDK